MSSIKCLNGDCLDVMKTLPDKSIDLFLCDLPYGAMPIDWDLRIDLAQFWCEVKRLCKNEHTPILMFCDTKYGVELINSNPKWFRYDLIWNKTKNTSSLMANKKPLNSHELIYVFSKKGAFYNRIDAPVEGKGPSRGGGGMKNNRCYNGSLKEKSNFQVDNKRCPISVLSFKALRNKKHPTMKPIELYEWLIERYSNEGDLVLDPTAGSFNSGLACKNLKRNYIGIELNKDYYENNKIE